MNSNSQDLSIQLANALFNTLSNYYIENTIRKEKETYEVLIAKKDSIEKSTIWK